MYKKLMLTAVLVSSLVIAPGCWSRKELNEIAVVMALGIDIAEGGYSVSAQVLNSSEAGSTHINSIGSLPVVTYKSFGKTIPDALQRMLSMAPRTLYLSHLRVFVFGEELARKGVGDAMDFISRNHELRTDFFLLVAKNSKASDILEVVTPFEYIPANSLYTSILASNKKWAVTGKVTLQHFITELKRHGSDPVLSGVELVGKKESAGSVDNVKEITPDTLLQHAGLAVFKKDRLVGWLTEPPSKAVNYILNKVDSTEGFIECPEDHGTVGFKVTDSKSSIDVDLGPDEEPQFTVNLRIEANLNAVQCSLDLTQPSVVAELEQEIGEKYNKNLGKHIETVQKKYGSDVFAFGEAFHRRYPKVWKKYRENWNDKFKSVSIEVNTKIDIRRIGSIVQPLNAEESES